ncbi:MAG: 50S ribosomal protein L22 [Proteobacteria bacterium]|jgi:large subunit ribosomal protein L22|nr:50S ribosomal protein L22 [Pseudomonadota bacterium]
MEVNAIAKYIRVSPQKARLVANLIKGKKVSDALSVLDFTSKASCPYISKLIHSAVASAEKREGIDIDTLVVKNIYVNAGPMLKRFKPASMGRGVRIRRRSSHITVILDEA